MRTVALRPCGRVKLTEVTPPAQVGASCDVAIVGAGAAGLATAIFTRRLNPRASVQVFEGARTPGAKILVSGGTRCNLTNVSVSEADFWGGSRSRIRRVLRAFPVRDTIAFFQEIGVHLHSRPGDAVDKVLAAYDVGVRRFDAAVGGLGGCPFAQDLLVGNIPTEKVIEAVKQRGLDVLAKPLEPVMRMSADIAARVAGPAH